MHWAAIHGDLRTVRSLIGARADVNVQSQGTLRQALRLTGGGHVSTPSSTHLVPCEYRVSTRALRRALRLTGGGRQHAEHIGPAPYCPGQRRTARASAVLPGRYTALHYAIDRDHRDVVAELLARGADVTIEDWQGCATAACRSRSRLAV